MWFSLVSPQFVFLFAGCQICSNILTFLSFRRRLPVQGTGSCRDLSTVLCQWSIPLWCSRLSGPFWQRLLSQLRSSSRALPLHLHFCNCSNVFCFISSVNMPDPFQPLPSHNHRYRYRICIFRDILISPVFQQAHSHCPSYNSHLYCCHIPGAWFSLELSCRKSLHSALSISTRPLPLFSPRLCCSKIKHHNNSPHVLI